MALPPALFLLLLTLLQHVGAFPKLEWKTTVVEEARPGELIGNIAIVSNLYASVERAQFTFKLRNDNPNFQLNEETSALKTRRSLNLEDMCRLREPDCDRVHLLVNVWGPGDSLKASVAVTIRVMDVNDHAPLFTEGREWTTRVMEVLTRKGSKIELPVAFDKDWTNRFSKVTYNIDEILNAFELKTYDDGRPYLLLTRALDREQRANYTFNLIARDDEGKQSSIHVVIRVQDIDDNPPRFEKPLYKVTVREDKPIGSKIVTVKATDPDEGQLLYEMGWKASVDSSLREIFQVRTDGSIILVQQLDYEREKQYVIPVRVRDKVHSAQAEVRVIVEDTNDNSPFYTLNPAVLTIMEESKSREPIGEVLVIDKDEDKKALFDCRQSDNPKERQLEFVEKKAKEGRSFEIKPLYSFDREKVQTVHAELSCWDKGEPSLSSSFRVKAHIQDINDNPPRFNQTYYTATIAENRPRNSAIMNVRASDADYGENRIIRFALDAMEDGSESLFHIDPASGRITTNRVFDREERDLYTLRVIARDSGKKPLSSTATVTIKILDTNDHTPRLTSSDQFQILEEKPANTWIGDLTAEDADLGPNGQVRFTLAPTQNAHITSSFQLLPNGTLMSLRRFDRETRSQYCMAVFLSDNSQEKPKGESVRVCVNIIDVNDNDPKFVKPSNASAVHRITLEDPAGQGILIVKAIDPDEGLNGEVHYSLTNNKKELFGVKEMSGEITLNRPLTAEEKGEHIIAVTARDRGTPSRTQFMRIAILVEEGPPRFFGPFDWQDNRNVLIVVILSTVSAFLAIVLISAIIFMVRPCGRRPPVPVDGHLLYKPSAEDNWGPHAPDGRMLNLPRVSNSGMNSPNSPAGVGMCVDSARLESRGRSNSNTATMVTRKGRNPNATLTRVKVDEPDQGVRIWPYDPERGRTNPNPRSDHERDHSDSGRGGSEDDLSSRAAAAGMGPVLQTFQTLDRHGGPNSPQPALHPGGPPPPRSLASGCGTLPSGGKLSQLVHIPMSRPSNAYTTFGAATSTQNDLSAEPPTSSSGAYERLQHHTQPPPAYSTARGRHLEGGGGAAGSEPAVSGASSSSHPPVKETAILDASGGSADGSKVDAHKLVEEIDNLFFKDMMV